MRSLSRQANLLFKKVSVALAGTLVIYTVLFAGLALWANTTIFPGIAADIADEAPWTEVSEERYRQINAMGQSTTLDA